MLGDRNFNNGTGLNAGAVLLVTTEDGVQTWSKLPVTGAIDSERVGSQVACSPDGSVVVATSESAATSLYVWNRQDDGSYLQVARVSIRDASALGETGPFYYPTGLALDDTGNVAVIGFVNRTVDTAGVAERCGGALVCMKIDGTWQLSQALTLERVAGRALTPDGYACFADAASMQASSAGKTDFAPALRNVLFGVTDDQRAVMLPVPARIKAGEWYTDPLNDTTPVTDTYNMENRNIVHAFMPIAGKVAVLHANVCETKDEDNWPATAISSVHLDVFDDPRV